MVANRLKTVKSDGGTTPMDGRVCHGKGAMLQSRPLPPKPAHSPPVQGFPPKFSTTVEKNVEKPGFSPWPSDECRRVAGFHGAKAKTGPFLWFSTRAAT